MGIMNRIFGDRKKGSGAEATLAPDQENYRQCDACGKLAVASSNANTMQIFTATIEHWSLDNMSGYCPTCSKFLCSDHLEWRNPSGEPMGPWAVTCKTCSTPVQGA